MTVEPRHRTTRPVLVRRTRSAPAGVQVVAAVLAALLPWAGLIKSALGLSLPIDPTVALVLVLAAVAVVQFAFELVVPPSLLAVAVLFLAVGLGLTNEPLSTVAEDKISRLFVLTLVGVSMAAIALQHPRQLRVFILTTLVVTGSLAATSLLVGRTVGTSGREALGSTPISTGQVAGAFAIVSLALVMSRRLPAWAGLGGAVLGTTACVATGSRGPVAALIAGACVLLIAASGSAPVRRIAAVGAAAVVVAFAAVAFAPDQALGRLGILLSGDPGTSGETRIYLAQVAARAALDNPLTGIGWGNLNAVVPPGLGSIDQRVYAHNLVLEIASEAGLIACAAAVVVLAVTWARGWRGRRSADTLTVLTLFTYVLVAASFSGDLNDNRGVIVLMVATLNSARLARSSQPAEPEDSRPHPQRDG